MRLIRRRSTSSGPLHVDGDALARTLAHQLRGTLAALQAFLRLVERDYRNDLPPQAIVYVDRALACSAEMSEALEALAEFTRVGQQVLKTIDIDADKLVAAVLRDLSAEIEHAGTEMRVGRLPHCAGDPFLLERVFSNLVANAIRYSETEDAPLVEIGSLHTGDEDRFFVRDNGVGFDEPGRSELFGMFEPLRVGDGLGTGLAIAKRIVERHGGRIWAEASEGHGATFWFTLGGRTAA